MAHRTTTHQAYDPRQVQEHIVETPLNEEMSKSFLEYAYSVIYARALPDARDGLKPVQRRIIYQMGEMNLTPDRPYMKSARVVGEVMGKLHPHGDSAIYEAMVRLAQPFAMRLALVDGHGNFGSLDDGPAASRYTEARLAPAALGMNADIDEDTVDFTPNCIPTPRWRSSCATCRAPIGRVAASSSGETASAKRTRPAAAHSPRGR